MLRRRLATFVLSGVAVVATAAALTNAASAADTTPPGPVTNLTAQSNTPTSVHLDWTNPTAADFARVRICRTAGTTVPTLPCTGLNVAKPTSAFTDNNQLLPNHQYTYALWAFDTSGNASARRSVTVRTQAKTPPGNVTNLTATPLDDGSIQLNWTNPGDADFAGVRLCRAVGTAPTLPCGIKLAKPANSYNDSRNLIPGTQYNYSVFAYDTVGTTASGAHVSATPLATPPANVTNLTATTLSDSAIKLDWTNPSDSDFAGVRICRAIGDTAPTLPCAGVNIMKPTNTFTDNNGLFPDTEYTYAVFSFDTVGGAASGATASATTDPAPLSAPVTNLTATATSSTSIKLDWTNPDDPNFAGVLICANLGDVAPTTPCTGVALANPTNTYTDDFNVFPGTQYTYAVFALNEEGNPSTGPSATVTTPAS